MLTDEEITQRVIGIVDNDLTMAEFANYRKVGDYVESKTLKAVGEWLGKMRGMGFYDNETTNGGSTIPRKAIQAFREGHWPV